MLFNIFVVLTKMLPKQITFIMLFKVVISVFVLQFAIAISVFAQEECGNRSLDEALNAYEEGKFDEVEKIIDACINTGYTRDQMVEAYRLLALTHIALDKTTLAFEDIDNILRIEPDYEAGPFDPQKFASFIKARRITGISLVTASKQAEPLNESPVPVIVITEQMIEAIGAKTLKDVLLVYVPGMTDVTDHNEVNIAMHGVYASSQQKILIMLNGHRLNSRAYSAANPDFSISLEKVKQIEVLRGPASSLYGNVALTSVINIITRNGGEVNGAQVKAGLGNHGQQLYSLLYGSEFGKEKNLLLWGQFYRSNGEKHYVPITSDHSPSPESGYAILDGFFDKPSYDAGFVYKNNDLSVMGDICYSKLTDPFTAGGITGEVYNYEDYRTFMGTGPGLGSGSGHLNVKYQKEIYSNELLINPYFDYNNVNAGLVIDPAVEQFGIVNWNEYSFGGIFQYKRSYDLKTKGNGNILFGMQADHMKLYDSFFLMGINGEFTSMADSSAAKILEPGSETILSGFIQMKHRFSKKWILNLGGRYDNKFRHMGANVSNFSPRLSAIFLPNKKFTFKLSYAQSFVDAPYWYRYNRLASYKGSENLQPEHLRALQFTSNLSLAESMLDFEINVFYNSLRDFIYRDPDATGDVPRYRNAGELNMTGVESNFSLQKSWYNLRANFTWMYTLDAKDYPVNGSEIDNVPSLSSNLILNFNPVNRFYRKSWINLTLRYIGKQSAPYNDFIHGEKIHFENFELGSVFLVNTGIKFGPLHNFKLNLTINNLLDKIYFQGGSVEFPYPKPGRWYMVSVQYSVK